MSATKTEVGERYWVWFDQGKVSGKVMPQHVLGTERVTYWGGVVALFTVPPGEWFLIRHAGVVLPARVGPAPRKAVLRVEVSLVELTGPEGVRSFLEGALREGAHGLGMTDIRVTVERPSSSSPTPTLLDAWGDLGEGSCGEGPASEEEPPPV